MENEASKFDAVIRKVLSVSHEEMQKRDKAWNHKRAQTKRAKKPALDRASRAKD